MGKPGSDLLFYILIIGGFLLFNYLARLLAAKAREQQEAAERAAAQVQLAEADEVLEDPWGRAPAAPVPAPQPPARTAASAPPPGRARAAHPLFRTPQDLRRAIVVMTVLGPCRALEPFDRR